MHGWRAIYHRDVRTRLRPPTSSIRLRVGSIRTTTLAVAGLIASIAVGVAILAPGGGRDPGSTTLPSVRLGPPIVLDRRAAGSASLVTTADGVLVALAFGMADAPSCPAGRTGLVDAAGRLVWHAEPAAQLFTVAGLPTTPTVVGDGLGTDCAPSPFVSTDAGATWQTRPRPGGFTLPMPWLALDPSDPGRVLAWTSGRLFLSDDLGRTWLSRTSSVRPLAIGSDGRLVGWTTRGIMTSTDGGERWAPLGAAAAGSAVGPRGAVAWGNSVVTAGTTGLVRVDGGGELVVLDTGSALALATGGRPGEEYVAAVVAGSDGVASLVVSRDGRSIDRQALPGDLGLSGAPLTAGLAAAASQIVVAVGDGQTVALVRVPVQLPGSRATP